MLRLHKLNKPFIDEAKDLEIPFFFAYPINSFYDLKYVADLGVSYVYLEAPIFFDMPSVKKFNIPVRLVPQMANNSTWSFVRDKAPFGSWIRPENMVDYEEYAEVVDFSNPPYNHLLPKQEEAYYRIYHDKRAWPGDIRAIIQDLGIYSLNRLIPTDVLHARLSCGQRCQSGGICRICERVLDFAAQEEELKEYKEMRENGELKTLEQLEEEELGYGEGRSSEAESN